MFRLVFQRDESSTGRQCPGKPDRTVSAQRANFQDILCPVQTGQQMQELALCRGHLDIRQTSRRAGCKGRVESRVWRNEEISQIAIDGGPGFVEHGIKLNAIVSGPRNSDAIAILSERVACEPWLGGL